MTPIEKVIKGLQIIRKHDPNADIGAKHDKLFAGSQKCGPTAMTHDEICTLTDIGWRWVLSQEWWEIQL